MKLKKSPLVKNLSLSCILLLSVMLVFSTSSCTKESITPPATASNTAGTSTKSMSITGATAATTGLTVPSAATLNTNTFASATYTPSGPVKYDGVNNITISGLSITAGSGPAISISNAINVHITLCRLVNGTNVDAVGIYLFKCTNVTIDFCYINNVSTGVYASTSTGVYVASNQMLNMRGPAPRGQFVQFNNCYGPGNKILGNRFENVMGQSNPEDAINIYRSNGVSGNPIMIQANWIRGGGPSKSGGGIALGDDGGTYQTASDNVLINPGQYGIAIASGTQMSIVNNQIYGAQAWYTNVGIFAWNQYESSAGCSIITISNNQVNFTAAGGYQNSSWNGGNCGTINGWNNNRWGTPDVNPTVLPSTMITAQ
ncbi:right-handed parallel beta-helix repeat-containing protein [Mucilaginibacter panaciglaebae]